MRSFLTMNAKPKSCDTFVVLPSKTKTGDVIFGKNADRPEDEVQEVIYVKGGRRDSRRLQCTYISIEESSDPVNDVILSKPAWTWGAEMGSNNRNVAIGNECISTNWNIACGDASVKRLLGADLVRLGLERGNTAENALDVITTLLETHGQGGSCTENDDHQYFHNSFLIADPHEAWVLETSGEIWAAEKIETGYRNISNVLTITTKIDKHSLDLHETTRRIGLWDGETELNFAACYGEVVDGRRQHSGDRLLRESSTGFDVKDMIHILRNKSLGICRTSPDSYPTQGSQVSSLNKDVSVHWFTGTYDPSISFFKPFLFTANAEISDHTVSPVEPGRQHYLYKLHKEWQLKGRMEADLTRINGLENKLIDDLEYISAKIENADAAVKDYDHVMKYCVEEEVSIYNDN